MSVCSAGVEILIPRIAEMKHTSGYKVWLRFEDGKEGEIDLEGEL